jgi:hypothetical protein
MQHNLVYLPLYSIKSRTNYLFTLFFYHNRLIISKRIKIKFSLLPFITGTQEN